MDDGTLHGGPDAQGAARWDFSSNANACGPAPLLLQALQRADAGRYPDPGYHALRERLAALHAVAAERIVIAASASEFITRITAAVVQAFGPANVYAPRPGYADYARAASAWQLDLVVQPRRAQLVWHAEPGSPLGRSEALPVVAEDAVLVVDRAYAALRLEGEAPTMPAAAWQLFSPNKALGLTGVRGAYALAPPGAAPLQQALARLAPSWPVGAHGVAMLSAWCDREVQRWVGESLASLRSWKRLQLAACEALGWQCEASVAPYFAARWGAALPPPAVLLPRLREHGVKLRDAASLGLPGWVRLSVQPPEAQAALRDAWLEVCR